MARVQYGTVVTEVKGKVQGQVFQGGSVGFVLRNKGYTKGISSQRRTAANANIAEMASRWRDLTDGQRDQWNALSPDWIFYNKFGAAYEGSGFQIFVAYNTTLRGISASPVSVPGAVTSPVDIAPLTLVYELSSGFFFGHNDGGSSDDRILIFAAAPQSPGRNINNNRYKKLAVISYDASDETDLQADYEAMYGTPVIGQRVTIQIYAVNQTFPYPFFKTTLTCLVEA